jgi:hypothetical protein
MATSLPFPPFAGTYRVLVVPVLESGLPPGLDQAFRDPDLTDLAAALRAHLFSRVTQFYAENSFGGLVPEFQIFGHDVAPRTVPPRLPKAIREYWNPVFEPGGIDAVVPGAAGTQVSFDGTESLRLRVTPRQRPQRDLDVPFAGLSAESAPTALPGTVAFTGAETLRLRVTDRLGAARELAVTFTAESFPVRAGSTATDLAAVAGYLDGHIRTATQALGLPPQAPALLGPVRLTRVPEGVGAGGRLVLDLSVHPDYGDGTAVVEVVAAVGLTALGLDTAAPPLFLLPGDLARLQSYVRRRFHVAQSAAGLDAANRLLGDPAMTIPGGALTTRVRLSASDGGAGSSLSVLAQAGLGKLGFDAVTSVPGTATAGSSGTVKESGKLLGDVLSLVNDALGPGDQTGWLTDPARDFRCVYVVFLGQPPPAPPTWDADAAALAGLRMFRFWGTVQHPTRAGVQVQGNWITSAFPANSALGTACHELGHTLGGVQGTHAGGMGVPHDWCLGLPDTYDNDPENQNQLRYLGGWDLMASSGGEPHLAGYHKRHLRWIPSDRIQRVDLPVPSGPTVGECWLVPVEHWDATLEADVRAAVGGNLPIAQLMEIVLPGDGGRFLLVEARAAGTAFSRNLPLPPGSTAALLVTDGIACSDPERYVVDFKYRRYAHPLNLGSELVDPGDAFDLATAPELAHEGTVVRVVGRQDVRGIPVLRARVERAAADFIDLHFTDTNPPWRNPDLWVDWPVNGRENRPPGTPYDQGDKVRYPQTGSEQHLIVARVHNKGTVEALNVDVRFYLWEPAGAGDRGEFRFLDSSVIPSVGAGAFALTEGRWNVTAANNAHQCLLAQIHDWDIPQAPGGGPVPVYEASTDLWLHNNRAQKNIVDFELKAGSPYEVHPLVLSIANSGPEDVLVYLEPRGLLDGFRLTCSPRELQVPARGSSQFAVSVTADTGSVPPVADSDHALILHACRWSRDMATVEAFGGWQLVIRPRKASTMTLTAASTPPGVTVTGAIAGATAADTVLVRLADHDGRTLAWRTATVAAGGAFLAVFGSVPVGLPAVQLEAHFDGNAALASVREGPVVVPVTGSGPGTGGGPGGGGVGPIGGGGVPVGGVPIGGGPVVVGGFLSEDTPHLAQAPDDAG